MTDPPIKLSGSRRPHRRQPSTRSSILADMLQSLRAVGDDMSPPQLLALLLLSARGSQSMRSIAEGLHLGDATVAAMCPLLVERGLVIRILDNGDPPGKAVILSTAGHRFVNDVIYRQGKRAGAFNRVPVTNRDLQRRGVEALHLA
jgi:DNA-binding MarR family transcriptional regulator